MVRLRLIARHKRTLLMTRPSPQASSLRFQCCTKCRERLRTETRRPRVAEVHLASRLAQGLVLAAAEFQKAPLRTGQKGKVGREGLKECVECVVVLDGHLDHTPAVPTGSVASLATISHLGKQVLPSRPGGLFGVENHEAARQDDGGPWIVRSLFDAAQAGSRATVGATAEPAVSADAVDYRALNPPAREGFKWNSFRRIETRGGVEEAYPPVSNEVIELDTAAESVGSVLASDPVDEAEVSFDKAVARVIGGLRRYSAVHDVVLAASVATVASSRANRIAAVPTEITVVKIPSGSALFLSVDREPMFPVTSRKHAGREALAEQLGSRETLTSVAAPRPGRAGVSGAGAISRWLYMERGLSGAAPVAP